MILRKPYAFFIKFFKPAHIILAILTGLLIYRTNTLLSFFNEYIYSINNTLPQNIRETLIAKSLFVIPVIIVLFSLFFLGIMFLKRKPIKFYIINIFLFLIVLVITIYASNFLEVMVKTVVSIKAVKIHRDLLLINMIIECLIFVSLIIRGLGINFKKFNFDSDISKLEITDADNEEFEVNFNLDLDSAKRNRKKRIRHLKYLYMENRFIINLVISSVVSIMLIVLLIVIFSKDDVNIEGVNYKIGDFDIMVNKTISTKQSFKNKIVTENNLIVVDTLLKSGYSSVSLFKKDFSLEIEGSYFGIVTNYDELLLDLGNPYNENILTPQYKNYLLIFEVPDKYMTSDMFLVYNNKGINTKIKLKPTKISDKQIVSTSKINDILSLKGTLEGISFDIENYDIKNEFLINYKYCIEKDCVLSKEYIIPSNKFCK